MKTILLIAALSLPASAGPVSLGIIGRSALPLPPGILFAPLSAPLVTPRFMLTPSPLAFSPVLPAPAPLLPTLKAAAIPAIAAQAAPAAMAAAAPVRAALAETVRTVAQAAPAQRSQAASAASASLFDGLKAKGAVNGVAAFSRPPDWSEDRRINTAIARLNESSIGRDLYGYVYQNHPDLRIVVDDAAGANYDARLDRSGRQTTLHLTQALVDRQSPEVVAAYMAREFSDLYFASFPTSAERGYMAYSNMARVFAELTNSGRRADGYWWNRNKDQYTQGAYAMERYYGSWREAVVDHVNGRRDARSSAFFQFLKGRDDSNTEPASKLSLREQYNRGMISWSAYQEMDRYFGSILSSESQWLTSTDRW
ncbi:MAG: hypothetical protein HY928_04265 [Elusimicrobia bacterium]|nr:hypothetical protein [Elusimicrobiota bacterium]